MGLNRRALLAGLAIGALTACTPPTPAELALPGDRTPMPRRSAPPSMTTPPTVSSAPTTTPTTSGAPSSSSGLAIAQGGSVTRDLEIARYGRLTPRQWGMTLPGVITRLPTADRVVALTFDACGGPNGGRFDQALISVLRRHAVPATLFLNSRWIDANPGAFADLAADPLFEIENHGTQHRPLSVTGRSAYGIAGTRDIGQVYDEIVGNRDKLTGLLGHPPRFFRTGTAFCDDVALRVVGDVGQQMVNFAVNGDAGATQPAGKVTASLLTATPRAIVICHMNQPGSGTAAGVDAAIPLLVSRGFGFVHLADHPMPST